MIVTSAVIMVAANHLVETVNINREMNFGKNLLTFSIIIIALIFVMYIFKQDMNPGNIVMKCGCLLLIYIYYLIDIYIILDGEYKQAVSINDHIYGSVKLFSDFAVGFVTIIGVLGGQNHGVAGN